jgi:hypothetical protein
VDVTEDKYNQLDYRGRRMLATFYSAQYFLDTRYQLTDSHPSLPIKRMYIID